MPIRAVVWRGGSALSVETFPTPEPAAGELVVAVRMATVCGSDVHTVRGHRSAPCPSVLGHEGVGEVVAAGPGAAAAVGDRVVLGVVVRCGRCDRCLAGRTAKCRRIGKLGHEPLHGDWPLSGTYAERVVVPAGGVVAAVPGAMPDEVAAPAGCATATVMAALEAAGPLERRRVLVSGAGMLGLTAVAASATAGAHVTVVDPDGRRRELARAFGAGEVRGTADFPDAVDVAIEVSGAAPAVASAYEALDVGGRLVLVGSVSPGPSLAIDPERVVRGWQTITGVHNYEPRHLAQALAFLESTASLPWADLVDPPTDLAGLADLLRGPPRTAVRSAVCP